MDNSEQQSDIRYFGDRVGEFLVFQMKQHNAMFLQYRDTFRFFQSCEVTEDLILIGFRQIEQPFDVID
jgi:hypothetical protein